MKYITDKGNNNKYKKTYIINWLGLWVLVISLNVVKQAFLWRETHRHSFKYTARIISIKQNSIS